MELDNLKIVSVLAILVTAEAYTIASDFKYTVCKWYNSRCEPFDATEFITLIENRATSEWPPGPFTLLTTNEGCPESSASGWRRGYLSFTWKRPQTLTLVTDCDQCRDQSSDGNTSDASNTTGPYRSLRNLTQDMVPDLQSYLLGPFSKYAWRLNFCSKIENSSSFESENPWPAGSYSVFGDGEKCPAGFTISERRIKFPLIMTWTSNGHLPNFSVKTKETENSGILVLKMCDHQTAKNETIGINNQITFLKASFIFIKSKGDIACPELQPMDVKAQTLQLHREVNDTTEVTEIFDICYYRPDTMQTDIGNYPNMSQNTQPFIRETAFSIFNPTLLYGKTTSTKKRSSKNTDFSEQPLLQDNQFESKTTPWLLVDLGRNFVVVGLQFTNFYYFTEAGTMFTQCFISEERWRLEEFGGISCQYRISYRDGQVYLNFYRQLEGRYVKLVGQEDVDNSKLYTATKHVTGMTTGKILNDQIKCNTDLGMGDESIQDHQITASSWKPQSPPASARPFSSGWCANTSDRNPYITTYSFDMFLPIGQPQSFFHSQILARFVTVYIVESMTASSKCIRFELHGCKENAHPEQVATKWTMQTSYTHDEWITFNNLQILKEPSIISSIAYPSHYPGGVSYTWIIDFPEDNYIQLVLTEMSFNIYEESVWNQCQDKLMFLLAYSEDSKYIDDKFNGLVTLLETNFTYTALTFTTCTPTSRIKRVGNGFKVIVRSKEMPTCFSARRNTENIVHNFCDQPTMFLTSLSRLNFPASNFPEQWTIHVTGFAIHLKILYFSVRCHTGSSLTIIDRFSGNRTYCNLNKAPSDWNSDSDTVDIRFEKGTIMGTASSRRISSRDGFKALYRTFNKPMNHLIDSQKTYVQDLAWKNTGVTHLVHQGCSEKFRKCYYIYSGAITSWKQAGLKCWIRRLRLVSIHSGVEHELITYILRNFSYVTFGRDTAFSSDRTDPNYFVHIGLSRITSGKGIKLHMWEDGSTVTYSAWKPDEPSSSGDCSRMSFHLFNTNDTWEAVGCETGFANYFVCETHFANALLDTEDNSISLYTGKLSRTSSGRTCQRWDRQTPHRHPYNLETLFPDHSIDDAGNHCRDPSNDGRLWCYTTDPNLRWETCKLEDKYHLQNYTIDVIYASKTVMCNNGDAISRNNWCDGIPNCSDLSDETNCTNNVHQLMQNRTVSPHNFDKKDIYSLFHCESKEWVSMLARCDSVIDCIDASDEINCSFSQGKPDCSKEEYACEVGGCIHISQMCDFIVDCMDGSDENCDYPLCSRTEYRCRNQQCIQIEDRCDSYENCLDGSDEENCDVCKANSFHCDLVRCIPKRLVCDKYIDCKDETDEMCEQPYHYSCEEWWNAGYRKSGFYKLNEIEAECSFNEVDKEGTAYTFFHNFEVTSSYGVDDIHYEKGDVSKFEWKWPISTTHWRNPSYSCFQNITQSCVPAYEASYDYINQTDENASSSCPCIIMTITSYKHIFNSALHFCDDKTPLPNSDDVLFGYIGNQLYFSKDVPRGNEITVGPTVCLNDIGNYLYMPQNSTPIIREPAFSVFNPTLLYGNTTSTIMSSSQNTDFGGMTLLQDNQFEPKTTPWVLVDLGRNFVVVGLQLTNYFLSECKSTDYFGSLNRTISGYVCQRWDKKEPHSHKNTKYEQFPDRTVSEAENYCRDPDKEDKIWCYTNSPSKRWEPCAEKVYNFEEEDTMFTQCFISEERWRLEEFGGISCQYSISYQAGQLYLNFHRAVKRYLNQVKGNEGQNAVGTITFKGRSLPERDPTAVRHEGRYVKLVGQEDIDNSKFYSATKHVTGMTTGKILNDQIKCNTDLGMGDGSIQDHQITASSCKPQFPPASARPFYSGWCANTSDTNPYIMVDMKVDTILEGITFFNWEIIDKHVDDGIYKKKYLPIGSKSVTVKFRTNDNKTNTTKTFNFDMFLPVGQPQRFFHSQILARFVTVYIVESMTASSKCIRFELHGCKRNAVPEQVATKWTVQASRTSNEEWITFNNLQILKESSVISSIDYPSHYSGGVSYTWIIDFPEEKYIQLVLTEMSFNIYEASGWNPCQDKLMFLLSNNKDSKYIDETFNGLVTLTATNFTYITLTFITCRPTSRKIRIGNGFKAIVSSKEIPTCFSARRNTENIVHNYCDQPTMFLTSLSRLNSPDSTLPEQWIVHVKRFSIHLKILYFNVRCDSGSSLIITDRFARSTTYCNLNRVPTEWNSDSETVNIRFEKGTNMGTSRRISSRDGFKALYRTFNKPMNHLIDSHKTHLRAVNRLAKLEKYWDPAWKNTTLFMYQGCSKKFGKCYYIYAAAVTSWKQAGQECGIRQSRLVSIHSDVEQELIKYILQNYRYVDRVRDTLETAFSSDKTDPNYFLHIGLSRVTNRKGIKLHMWEDGSPVTFSAWKQDGPSSNEDCTRMSFHQFNTNNTWEAEGCETGLANFFVCESPFVDAMLNNFVSTKYNGTLNVTLSGLPCQRWDKQYPHKHNNNENYLFPEQTVSDAENFCRDPDEEGFIWCYTVDPAIRFERCYEDETEENPIHLYTGNLSRTSSGRTCQRWDRQSPHSHLYFSVTFFPDHSIDDAANHCRDPSNDGILWCYTTDPNSRWETCNLEDIVDMCNFTHSSYAGQWNITRSGITCQAWESQSPHDHELFFGSQFPDGSVTEAYNYCRDPYNEGFLWCFTMDPATLSDPCVFDYKYQLQNYTSDAIHTTKTAVCNNGDVISRNNWCDGIPNCSDLSDETNCTNNVHQLTLNRKVSPYNLDKKDIYSLFHCESKEWVSMLARCDSLIDCIDASDEINCSFSQGKPVCSKEEYSCEVGGCIHISQMCDFIVDCVDGSDENCDYPLCSRTEYRCWNQQCIPIEERCDSYENCLGGSDEKNCDVCKGNSFHCDIVRCIPKRLVCDKYIDCNDETDEMCEQPFHYSCEEWWKSGYRKSGLYKLKNDTEAECRFDKTDKEGTVLTYFHNFEVTFRYGFDNIHYGYKDVSYLDWNTPIITTHLLNSSYSCFQNITQSCVPAYEASYEYINQSHKNASSSCACIIMTIIPFKHSVLNSSLHFCDKIKVPNRDQVLFGYDGHIRQQLLYYYKDLPRGMEITVGPTVCLNVHKLEKTNTSLVDEHSLVPGQMLCVFDIDPAGFITGSRSGKHLQECAHFDCPKNTVKCPGSFCLPLKFICDGEKHCPGGQDEEECGCMDEDREVLLLFEDMTSRYENQKIRQLATQFYTANSIVRELRYKAKIRPDKLKFHHRFLHISDTVISPYSNNNRQFACNYTILASDFVNKIEFSKKNKKGILFFQNSNESGVLAKLMFQNVRSAPEFLIYRIIQDPFYQTSELDKFTSVTDVVVTSWNRQAAVRAKYFPELCTEAATVLCPNEYKCAASKTCIPLEQVCDGQAQCLYGDDERFCEYTCPENCTCVEYTTDCSFAYVDNRSLPYLHTHSRLLELNGNTGLRDILLTPMLRFPYLIYFNISMCGVEEIGRNIFQSFANLQILDISFNNLIEIRTSAFVGLRKLKMLNLLGNRDIFAFQPYSLDGLSSIRNIEITGANIHKLSSHTFAGLNLDKLKLSDNNIREVEDDVFFGLTAKVIDMETNRITVFNTGLFRGVSGVISLRTPAFKYCCVRPNYLMDKDCFPEKDEFSSCADLLRISALQTMLWLIGILALFGNILSVIYRLIYDRERLKLGFGIFVTNLAVADILMGIYLTIIAIADAAYRKRYIFMDDYWRNSTWCTLAGFLSTVSSEASVFFLCLITLDRLLVIKYPFGQIRFDTKYVGIFTSLVWVISVSVGLIPIMCKNYFQDKFYSKSAVCIALPLTRDRPPGWLYSVIIFIGLNFVTFCLIAIGQAIIYFEIKKSISGIKRLSARNVNVRLGRRRELTVTRNLLLVATTDFLCWFPIGCMGMMALSGHVIPGEVYAWTGVFILPVNSALNPVLYTLSAILEKNKVNSKAQEEIQLIRLYLNDSMPLAKKSGPFKGLFQYFITKADRIGHTFASLDDLGKNEINPTSNDILKLACNLSRCLCLLHRNSMVVKLDGRVIYACLAFGKVTGEIQIRKEPSECFTNKMKKENMYQLGQVVRLLLVRFKKARDHPSRYTDKHTFGTEEYI